MIITQITFTEFAKTYLRCIQFSYITYRVTTQHGHPFVSISTSQMVVTLSLRGYEYQSDGGDSLRLRSKGGYGSCAGGR